METQTSSCQCPYSNHFVLVGGALLVAILGGVVGAFANSYFNTRTSGNNNQPTTFTYVVTGGTDVSLKQKEPSPTSNLLAVPEDPRNVYGLVTEVGGDRITLDTRSMNLPLETALNYRTIAIGVTTKISKLTLPAKITTGVPLATQYLRTSVGMSSIAKGDRLTVTAAENIGTKKEFTASEIKIMPR